MIVEILSIIITCWIFKKYLNKNKGTEKIIFETHPLSQIIGDDMGRIIKNRKQKNIEIIIKEASIDAESVVEVPHDIKKFIYRPQALDEYIGQFQAKDLIKLNIEKIKKFKYVHFLISGQAGYGKTTLAHIIKNMLSANIVERIAGQIKDSTQIVDIINNIGRSDKKNNIFFIDEIHGLKTDICELLYSIMEDFSIAGKQIKPFVLIGATTEKNDLKMRVSPMVERFQEIDLVDYTINDIDKILKQYKKQLYSNEIINDFKFKIIAKNSKCIPRIAINLLEDSIIEPSISKVFNNHKIVKNGLTEIDIKILSKLRDIGKAVGEEALSQMVGISKNDYKVLYEPYLCRLGYINRTRGGRVLSILGEKILKNTN